MRPLTHVFSFSSLGISLVIWWWSANHGAGCRVLGGGESLPVFFFLATLVFPASILDTEGFRYATPRHQWLWLG